MSNKENNSESANIRTSIIQAVQTPLGFFTLVVLTVEFIFGIVAAMSEGADRTYLIIAMVLLMFFLVILVTCLAVWRPESLRGQRPKTTISKYSSNKLSRSSLNLDCSCELSDLLYLSPNKQSERLSTENRWEYENSNCKLLLDQFSGKAHLKFDSKVKDNNNYESQFEFTAFGSFDGGNAFMEYRFSEKGKQKRSWNGVCILRIPKASLIYGFWMTTGILNHNRVGLGSIQLYRK